MPDINGNELNEKLHEIVYKANIRKAIKNDPVYKIREILELKNITALRGLGKLHKVPGCSKMEKAEIIPHLAIRMTNREMIVDLLQILDKNDWDMFKAAVKKKQVTDDMLFSDAYWMMNQLGVLTLFYHAGHFHYVIPSEIQEIYRGLEKEGFPARKEHGDLINVYAIAAVNLYGVIKQDDFTELFNGQNSRKTDIYEMRGVLQRFAYMDVGYCLWNEYIVNDYFEGNKFRDVLNIVSAAAKKPRYIPKKEQFLKFAEKDFIEETPQLNKLRTYINAHIDVDASTAEDILDEYYYLARSEADLQHFINLFEQNGLPLEIEQIKALIGLVNDLYYNSRRWSNNGHTPAELGLET